jgi:hypothetical protein
MACRRISPLVFHPNLLGCSLRHHKSISDAADDLRPAAAVV